MYVIVEWNACSVCLRGQAERKTGWMHTTMMAGTRPPDRHHIDISQLSPFTTLSITSNPPKTHRIEAQSITHSSLHSSLLYREITAEREKQSGSHPLLSNRKAPGTIPLRTWGEQGFHHLG
jgi:hypothetical protein